METTAGGHILTTFYLASYLFWLSNTLAISETRFPKPQHREAAAAQATQRPFEPEHCLFSEVLQGGVAANSGHQEVRGLLPGRGDRARHLKPDPDPNAADRSPKWFIEKC